MRKEENKKRLRVAGNKKGNIQDREREPAPRPMAGETQPEPTCEPWLPEDQGR